MFFNKIGNVWSLPDHKRGCRGHAWKYLINWVLKHLSEMQVFFLRFGEHIQKKLKQLGSNFKKVAEYRKRLLYFYILLWGQKFGRRATS